MSIPKITEADLHAHIDGELASGRDAEVEAHLAATPDAADRLAAYRRNEDALRVRFDPILEEPVPDRLARRQNSGTARYVRYAMVAGWVVLGGIAGWYLHGAKWGEHPADAPAWARRAAVAHAVYSPEVRHPVEVGADQEAHLIAWLSKRLGTQLRIPQLNGLGYSLVGGRLLPGEQGPVAQLMYQEPGGQRLTLYVRTNGEHGKETAFRFAQDGSVRVFYWIDRGLGLALSGEITKEELLRVATAVYQQLNP
jgi:anti-sigma factor RsiW